MKDVLMVGIEKAGEGLTSLDEVLKATVLEKAE